MHWIKFIFLVALILLPSKSLGSADSNKVLIYTNAGYINSKKEVDLVLYFPGQGCWSIYLLSDYKAGGLELEPQVKKYRSNLLFAAIDTDSQNHYGSLHTASDILSTIKKLRSAYNIKHIYLIGGSIGASLILNLASTADDDIKNKISGIVVYLPITDYAYTLKYTKNTSFKEDLNRYFLTENKDQTLLKKSSPITYVKDLPQKAKIDLIIGTDDTTAPPQQALVYFQEAKDYGKNIYIQKVKANHDTKQIAKILESKIQELLK